MHRLATVFLAAAISLSAADTGISSFFTAFVPLFAKADHAALVKKKMVTFPLKLKGTLDDSPEISASVTEFAALLPKLAKQPSGLNPANYGETEAEHLTALLKKAKLPEDAGNNTARAGNLVFRQDGHGWKLIKAYVSDDLISEIQRSKK